MKQPSARVIGTAALATILAACTTPTGGGTPQSEPQNANQASSPPAAPLPDASRRPAPEAQEVAAQPVAEAKPAAGEPLASEKKPEPVTGAFGLRLGNRFAPDMVDKVLSQKEHGYRDRNKLERKGTLYEVVPKAPSEAYTQYLVATTTTGVIYSVSGVYADPEKKSRCDATRRLAAELEQKYGEPRGKGAFGNWYSFRDMSAKDYRGVRLYASQCRSGRYSIVYVDDGLKTPGPPPTSGHQ